MSDVTSLLEPMEVPIVTIKTELDHTSCDVKSEFKTKIKPNFEIPDTQDDFLCSICRDHYTDQKGFFDHLESHYLPESPEYFKCSVCQEIFEAQNDFYIHMREHYKPSLMSELGNSITGYLQWFRLIDVWATSMCVLVITSWVAWLCQARLRS